MGLHMHCSHQTWLLYMPVVVGTIAVRPLQIDFLFLVLAKQTLPCGRVENSIIPLY